LISIQQLQQKIAGVLNAPARPSALYPLARVKYPLRELMVTETATEILVYIARYGYSYKFRGEKPKKVALDLNGIQTVFENALSMEMKVLKIIDADTGIYLVLAKGEKNE